MSKLIGYGAPTDKTIGAIGDIYTNEATGTEYECVGIHEIKTDTIHYYYVWVRKVETSDDGGQTGSASSEIKTFPTYDTSVVNGIMTQYKVNLEALDANVIYGICALPCETQYIACGLYVIADDGTERLITNVMNKNKYYYVVKSSNNIALYDAFGNSRYDINISDKSTSNNITFKNDPLSNWIPTSNTIAFTPTSDYHPATKKYVDDTFANVDNSTAEVSWDDLTDKPFYDEQNAVVLFENEEAIFDVGLDGMGYEYFFDDRLNLQNGNTYRVTFGSEVRDIVCENDRLSFDGELATLTVDNSSVFGDGDISEDFNYLKIEEISSQTKLLDEKFIPDTIARISDIPETPEQTQVDWNQSDETAVDYIKNRTHYEKDDTVERKCSFEYEKIDSYEKLTRSLQEFYKISNDIFSRTSDVSVLGDLGGTKFSVIVQPTSDEGAPIRIQSLAIKSDDGTIAVGQFCIVYEDEYTYAYKTLTRGMWLITYNNYTKSTSQNILNYVRATETIPSVTIKQLDEKFIPDTIARKEDVNSVKDYTLLKDSVNGYEYIVQMRDGSLISVCKCASISIDTMPNKTEYYEGETLDLSGLVVIVTRQDGSTSAITDYVAPSELPSDGVVSISYTEAGITYSTSFDVTISSDDGGDEIPDIPM